MHFLLVLHGRRNEFVNVFTQTSNEDAGPDMRGQNEESFNISPGTVTRTGLTQDKYSLCMDILSASYSYIVLN